MRNLLAGALAAILMLASDASAQSERQLVVRAKQITTEIWPKAKFEAVVMEHDVIVTLTVPDADEQVRESITAFVELAGIFRYLHRHLHFTPGFDCALNTGADMCKLTYIVPMPLPKPNELLPNNKPYRVYVPRFAFLPERR